MKKHILNSNKNLNLLNPFVFIFFAIILSIFSSETLYAAAEIGISDVTIPPSRGVLVRPSFPTARSAHIYSLEMGAALPSQDGRHSRSRSLRDAERGLGGRRVPPLERRHEIIRELEASVKADELPRAISLVMGRGAYWVTALNGFNWWEACVEVASSIPSLPAAGAAWFWEIPANLTATFYNASIAGNLAGGVASVMACFRDRYIRKALDSRAHLDEAIATHTDRLVLDTNRNLIKLTGDGSFLMTRAEMARIRSILTKKIDRQAPEKIFGSGCGVYFRRFAGTLCCCCYSERDYRPD